MERILNSKYFLLFILIFALFIRIISLNQSFWLDEATSGYVARDLGFYEIVKFGSGDFHPPLYYLLLKAWGSVFGFSETALRLMSVVSSIGTIVVVYLLSLMLFGKNKMGKRIAILSSLMLATSGLFIYYSHEARMYALETFLAALSVFSYINIKKNRFSEWLMYSVSITLLCFTDYLVCLMTIVIFIHALYKKRPLYWWRNYFISHIPLILLALLWFPTFKFQLSYGTAVKEQFPVWWSTVGSLSLKSLSLFPAKFILGRISFTNKYLYAGIVGILSAVYGFVILRATVLRNKKTKNRSEDVVWIWLAVPLIISIMIGFRLSVVSYFRFIFVLPAFYILLSLGIVSLNRKFSLLLSGLVLSVNLLSSFYYLANPKFHREDWRGLINYIKNDSSLEDSTVVFPSTSGTEAFRYYDPEGKIDIKNAGEVDALTNKIWLIRYAQPIFDVEDSTRKTIEDMKFKKGGEKDFNGVVVWEYQRPW